MTVTEPRRLVLVSLLLTSASTLPQFLIGGLSVQIMAELGFGVAALGATVALSRLIGAVLAVRLGRIADRLGPSGTTRIVIGLVLVISGGTAVVSRDWWTLTAFMMLTGVSNLFAETTANTLLGRGVTPERQGLAFGLKQAAMPATTALAGIAVPAIALTIGWRWAFAAAAIPALVLLGMVPSAPRLPRSGDRGAVDRVATTGWLQAARAGLFFSNAASSSVTTFAVSAAVIAGLGEGPAGVLLAVGGAAALAGRIASGVVVDRYGIQPLRLSVRMLVTGSVGFLLIATGRPAPMAVGVVIALGLGWGFNGLVWLGIMRVVRGTPGRATGIVLSGAMYGGLIGPLTAGWLIEQVGYAAVWAGLAVVMLAGAACFEWSRRLVRRDISLG